MKTNLRFQFGTSKIYVKMYVDKIWGWNDDDQKQRLKQDLEEHLAHKRIILVDSKKVGVYAVHITENGDLFINEISILKEYEVAVIVYAFDSENKIVNLKAV